MTEHIPATRRRPAEDGPSPLYAARQEHKAKFGKFPGPKATLEEINAKLSAPVATVQAQTTAGTGTEPSAAPAKRRRRASVGGHAMKLQAPERPGFVRRWFNDDGNRLAEAEELGYTPVSEARSQTPGLGSTDNRLVGTKANGEPLRAVLMETPDELYAEGVAEREAHNRQIDDAITAGVDSTGQLGPKAETYGQGSIKQDR